MALIHYEFYSCVLERNTAAYVVIPEYRDVREKSGKRKVLYLFHGLGDNYTKWVRRTSIERYAREGDWVVIMPDGEKGYYTNCADGERYGDYIGKELPDIMRATFPFISDKREDTFVAGLSMGGYGSIRLALNHPGQFHAAASFSGCLNITREFVDYPQFRSLYKRVFGAELAVEGTENDLFYMAEKCNREGKEMPHFYISCGTEDDMYPFSLDFCRHLDKLGAEYTWEEWKGGHDWVFWDESIRRALKWFVNNK